LEDEKQTEDNGNVAKEDDDEKKAVGTAAIREQMPPKAMVNFIDCANAGAGHSIGHNAQHIEGQNCGNERGGEGEADEGGGTDETGQPIGGNPKNIAPTATGRQNPGRGG
jgi:hypothetical protein